MSFGLDVAYIEDSWNKVHGVPQQIMKMKSFATCFYIHEIEIDVLYSLMS